MYQFLRQRAAAFPQPVVRAWREGRRTLCDIFFFGYDIFAGSILYLVLLALPTDLTLAIFYFSM